MAIKVTRQVVCDLGDRHSGEIQHWRLTVDGETQTFDLCPSCARPLTTLWDKGGRAKAAPQKMRVMTMAEIEAQKTKEPPHLST